MRMQSLHHLSKYFCFLLLVTGPVSLTGQQGDFEDGLHAVLVIDRSGSMDGDNKIVNAKIAANTFVAFMQTGDVIAVVSFSDSAQTDFALETILSEEIKSAAQTAIDSIRPGGSTSIGSGLQRGQSELNKRDVEQLQAMLLLSDGRENVHPYVPDILPGIRPETDVYTVGLGYDVDGALLNKIAVATGGSYFFTPTADELQHIYVLLRGRITGQQVLSLFSGTLLPGETHFYSVTLDSLISVATFSLVFHQGDIDLALTAPDSTLIDPQVALAYPEINYTEGSSFDFYSVAAPRAGQWTLKVSGVDIPGPEPYSVVVQVYSDLEIETFLDKSEYKAGQPILVTAVLTENKEPVRFATITADARIPASSTSAYQSASYQILSSRENAATLDIRKIGQNYSTMTLFDDGLHSDGAANDGVYANYFTNTVNDGSYTFTIRAFGVAEKSGKFMRESSIATYANSSTAPAVVAVTPDSVRQGETLSLVINGANFFQGAQIAFSGSGITILSFSIRSANKLTVDIAIGQDAEPGFHDVTITNINGQQAFGPGLLFVITIPSRFELLQNYPNPFNPETTIGYTLPAATLVKLDILNILGQRVKTLINAEQLAGFKSVVWNAQDDKGEMTPSGIYFYRLTVSGFTQTRRLLLLR